MSQAAAHRDQPNSAKTMTFWQRKESAQRLRAAVPLESVLRLCDCHPDGDDKRKWHTPRGILSLNGPKFMNWSLGVGGGGALDLVMHLQGLNFKAAVDWLALHVGQEALSSQPIVSVAPAPLRLPPPDPSRLGRVTNYLVRERAIPLALLEPLVAAGTLYADSRANAVFLLRGKDGVPVGAELRGTSRHCWRGLAPGTRKELGFFGVGVPALAPGRLILCESAIDALSCGALNPDYGCISTAGARPNPRWLAPLLERGYEIYCGFDRDLAGEQMAQTMIAYHPAIQRLRPEVHDWNDQLKALASPAAGSSGGTRAENFTTWKEEPSVPQINQSLRKNHSKVLNRNESVIWNFSPQSGWF